MAALVWLAERPIPSAYRRAGFHAISESTRDDLVARGVPAERITGHPSRASTAVRLTPDPAVARDAGAILPLCWAAASGTREWRSRSGPWRWRGSRRPELSLDIAGTGDDRPRLEPLAGRAGVRRRGSVPRVRERSGEAALLLRATWANLFPSPKEGWGITIIEAAACGTPSLASDSPGLRDSVRHGETGFLVPHGDVEALAARMLELADAPAPGGARSAPRPAASPSASPGTRAASDHGATPSTTSSPARRCRLSQEEAPCRRPSPPATARFPTSSSERARTVVERLGEPRATVRSSRRSCSTRTDRRPTAESGCTSRAARCWWPVARRRITAPRWTGPRKSCAASSRRTGQPDRAPVAATPPTTPV